MAGAGSKRAKRDRQAGNATSRNPTIGVSSAAVQGGLATYDGPSDPPRSRGPGSGGGPPTPSRGRTPSNGPPSAVAPSARGSSHHSATGRVPLTDPARPVPVINRNVDWAGNAYNLYSTVSLDFATLRDFNIPHVRHNLPFPSFVLYKHRLHHSSKATFEIDWSCSTLPHPRSAEA